MPSSLPTPLAAALGVVPALLSRARQLPRRAISLPVIAVSGALSTMDAFRREYDDLAERGEALVARLRGETVQAAGAARDAASTVTETVEDAAARAAAATPFAPTPPEEATPTADAVHDATAAVASVSGSPAQLRAVPDVPEPAAARAADPQAPKGTATPKATEPDSTRVDTAASSAVQEAVEQAVAGVTQAGVGAEVDHDELPLADYDHMTLGSLRGRLRALTVDQLVQIRAYEKSHADRLPVVTMLDNRIAKLATDSSATPSGPVSTSPAPEQLAAGGAGGSKVSPATTTAPTINPPSHGDPTNPSQPR